MFLKREAGRKWTVRATRDMTWATEFTPWATEKTVAQGVGARKDMKKGAPWPLSLLSVQRYNAGEAKANVISPLFTFGV